MKTCVSLYSLQEMFYLGKLDFEGCVAAVSASGAQGIEILPEMNCCKQYKNPTPAFVETWKGWMEKYHLEPVCLDIFPDYKLYANRFLTLREQLEMFRSNVEFGKKLGFSIIRGLRATSLYFLEQALPLLEEYDVSMGIELHSPTRLSDPYFGKLFELIERTGTRRLGLVLDLSIFTNHAPGVLVRQEVRKGARQVVADYVCEQYDKRTPQDEIERGIRQMGGTPKDFALLKAVAHSCYEEPTNLTQSIVDKIKLVHAKSYEVDENDRDTCIDCETVIPMLASKGYTGYISTEYEGQRFFHDPECGPFEVDEVEQLNRHQRMLKRLIAGTNSNR